MSASLPRRAFLEGLARLPLIGGGVSIVGRPTACAQPITGSLLLTYADFLFYERRILISEIFGPADERARWMEDNGNGTLSSRFHWDRPGGWSVGPMPSSRAAVVLGAAGCPWTEEASGRRLMHVQRMAFEKIASESRWPT